MPEQLQAIIRHIDQAVLHLDADGRISVLNPAAERLFGLTFPEAQGLVYAERQWGFLREDGSPCPLDEHPPLVALRTGRPQKEGILGRRHDGGVTWLSVTAQPILPPGQERPAGVVATFTDITRFKRTEEALRENEERFRTLFENASDAIFIHDLKGRFIEVNPAACRHLGYTREELLQRTVVEIDSPESAALVPQKMAHLFEHGVIASESSHVAKDGRVIPVEFHASLFTLLGQPAVLAIARDITERKRSEDALRRSERRFRQLYDHTPIAYQSLDSDGLILDVNQAWLNCLGYTEEEVLGRWFGSFLAPAFLPHFERNFPCFKEAGSISGVEFQMVKKDGSPILVSFNGSIASDAEGNMLRTHCVFLDITEQRRLEAQLRQSQKMEAVGTLAGGIAHDFNNILAAIMGFAEIAAEDARQGEVNPADLEQILISSQRAKELVQRILAFSRKSEPDQTPVNLNRVVGRAVAMLQRTLPKMIALETDLDDRLPPVWADAAQIEQVLLNLAGNAADAMPEGGKLIIETQGVVLDAEYCRAHLEVRPGRYAQLMVRDTGLGMDAATMERIFEPFFTTK
ncbi:MAG: PAS domain S-box protein, partial [Syntrophobacterales bacterium]|nr:PAS domain S-box protein [Syntrophobacterales bacterium]